MGVNKARYLMALDFGTGAGRCVVISVDGKEHYSAYHEWAFDAPRNAQPGGFSFDPGKFWQVLGQVSREAMQKGGIRAEQVVAVSTTSLREGFVLLDAAGEEIWAVPNRDARAFMESIELHPKLGQQMNDVSGHWINPIMAPARLLWLKRHDPGVLERARTLLMINDWMLYRLCGEKACEPSNAAETCVYDICRNEWSAELIEACGMPREIFPAIVRGGEVLGRVTAEAAAVTGLAVGTPVVVGGADTQCGVLGSGVLEAGETAVIAGTSTPIQMALDKPIIDKQGRTWSGPHIPRRRWVLESNAGLSGSTQRWFRDSFFGADMANAKNAGRDAYELMAEEAERSPIGSAGVVCLLGGALFNASRPFERHLEGFVLTNYSATIAETDSRRHFARSILESHAFAVRANCEQLQAISGRAVDRVTVCGGWSGSDYWTQMLADCLGVPVERPAVAEATSAGAIVCAGVGAGEYGDMSEAVQALVVKRAPLEPDVTNGAAYDQAYKLWRSLYAS